MSSTAAPSAASSAVLTVTPASAVAKSSPANSPGAPSPSASTSTGGPAWTTYHADNMRLGVGPAEPALAAVRQLWSTPVDGEIYAEPLFDGQRLLTVTENDTAYALDPASGAVMWQQHVAEPVPLNSLPCGNINPSGMTSTPVVDPDRGLLYAVGRALPAHHDLFAFDLNSGAVKFRRSIDPPGADPRYLQQRSALSLANNRIYVPFGGNFGDCGPYRGAVVAVNADGQGNALVYTVPTQREGAIWAPSGATINSAGELFVATGNAASTSQFDYGNAVIRLSPNLKALDYWAPADWAALSRSDTDIGSIGPVPVSGGQLFQTGKNGVGYLLQADHLGEIGGQLFSAPACGVRSDGGSAYQPPLLYVPCLNGLVALRIEAGAFSVAWRVSGARLNAPIVAYGSVWAIANDPGELYQIDPANGAVRSRTPFGGALIPHFVTPTPAGGRIFVPAGRRLLAFGT